VIFDLDEIDGEVLPKTKVHPLLQEAYELAAIFVASARTAKSAIISQKSKMD